MSLKWVIWSRFSDCSSSLCTGDFIVKRGRIKIEAQPKVVSKRNKRRDKSGIIKFQGNISKQNRP